MTGRIALCLTSTLILCSCSLSAKAESNLAKIKNRGVLNVAIREDAAPFGYVDSRNNLQGYCLDFFVLLEKRLLKHLKRNNLTIKLFKSTANNRFSLVSSGIVDLECGSNTIRNDAPKKTGFSTEFFVTGTQFLINKNNRNRFKFNQNLKDIRLGVIKNTTTEKFITETYPLARIVKFSGVTARNRSIQALSQGKLDATVSDGILLRYEAQQQGLSTSEYSIIPKTPLTCDRYGMILSRDRQWQDFVNSVIDSPESAALSQTWFGSLPESGYLASNSCG